MAREEQVSVRFSRTIYHRRTVAVNPALETFLTVANADVRISRIRSGGLNGLAKHIDSNREASSIRSIYR